MEVRIKHPNPLQLRNVTNPGDLGYINKGVSFPVKLITEIDMWAGKQSRSAFICKIIEEWFMKKREDDPRFILGEVEHAIEDLEQYYKLEKAKLIKERTRLEVIVQEKHEGLLI